MIFFCIKTSLLAANKKAITAIAVMAFLQAASVMAWEECNQSILTLDLKDPQVIVKVQLFFYMVWYGILPFICKNS